MDKQILLTLEAHKLTLEFSQDGCTLRKDCSTSYDLSKQWNSLVESSATSGNHGQRIYGSAEERLGRFDFRNESLTVALFQKFRFAKRLSAVGGLGFNSFEQLRSGLIQKIRFAFDFGLFACWRDQP